ncbi:MAG: hypothetical protein D6731_20200 [Planctomycetota bacterium]|nr:MAG: hypothetical protein D6731_20200 [Planctomycetota bacterium]
MVSPPRWSSAPRLLAVAVGLLFVAFCLREDVQPDLYFHLAAGRWIAAHGLPESNVFLAVHRGNPYVDHEWLFQCLAWPAFRLGGGPLLATLKNLALLAAFAALARALGRTPVARWFVLAAAIVVGGGRFVLRPEVVSIVGVALHLWLLRPAPRKPLARRALLCLPLFQIAWSNAHGLSALGPILTATALAGAVLDARVARRTGRHAPPPGRARALALLLALEALASLFNPYGPKASGYLFYVLFGQGRDTATAAFSPRIVELRSPFDPALRARPEVLLFSYWLLGAPLLYGLALWRRRARPSEGLLALPLVATAIPYVRNLPLAALGLALPTAAGLGALGEWLRSRRWAPGWGRGAVCGLGAAAALFLARAALADRFHENDTYDARPGLGLGSFPTYPEEVAWLAEHPPSGALFNDFGSGHYLLYARGESAPGLPAPSICGNADLYPRAWLERYHRLLRGEEDLFAALDELGVSDVFLDHRGEVDAHALRVLLGHPQWGLVHAGPHALVFRRGAADLDRAALARSIADGWRFPDERPDDFPPTRALRWLRLLPPRRVRPLGRLRAARLLDLLGLPEAALDQAHRAEAIAPGEPVVLRTLAELEQDCGQVEKARTHWRALADAVPTALPWVKLGLLALRRGREGAPAAIAHFRTALAREPDSRLARENLLAAYELAEDPVELRRALARTPKLAPARRHYYLGSAALLEGDLPRARTELAAATAAEPQLAPAWALYAEALGRLGTLPEAEEAWARLCALTPRDASAWRALGDLRRARRDLPGALAAYHRARELAPTDDRAPLAAAEFLLDAGRPEDALPWIRGVLRRKPRHSKALKLYARITSGEARSREAD